MTDSSSSPNPARARAEAAFRTTVVTVAPEAKESAMSEYKAGLEAVRLRMASQRAARLARDSGRK
jgi:hypothetical protein